MYITLHKQIRLLHDEPLHELDESVPLLHEVDSMYFENTFIEFGSKNYGSNMCLVLCSLEVAKGCGPKFANCVMGAEFKI